MMKGSFPFVFTIKSNRVSFDFCCNGEVFSTSGNIVCSVHSLIMFSLLYLAFVFLFFSYRAFLASSMLIYFIKNPHTMLSMLFPCSFILSNILIPCFPCFYLAFVYDFFSYHAFHAHLFYQTFLYHAFHAFTLISFMILFHTMLFPCFYKIKKA